MMRHGILKEIFAMAFDSLKTHKLRSFLTLLGIMIGVMTVIGMVSIIQGLNKSFLSELEAAGSDLIIIQKYEAVQMGEMSEEMRKRKDLTWEDAKAIEQGAPLVHAVAANINSNIFDEIPVKYRNISSDNTLILGSNEKFPVVYNIYLPKEGRFLTESEITHSSRAAMLGFETAETLFPHTSAVGKEIRIGPEKFTVVGVLNKRGQMFGQSRDNFAAIPITTFMKYFDYDKSSLQIGAIPKTPGTIQETIDQIRNVLRQRRKVGFGKPDDFEVFTQESMLDLYNQITGAAYLVMVVISSIGLLVGGIGVMNIMLISVTERTMEIGVRKAIGARRSDIRVQFLLEAVMLTFAGGVLGVILGAMVSFTVRALIPTVPATLSIFWVAMGVAISAAVGLFFGYYPANRAAGLDPIVCLRYE